MLFFDLKIHSIQHQQKSLFIKNYSKMKEFIGKPKALIQRIQNFIKYILKQQFKTFINVYNFVLCILENEFHIKNIYHVKRILSYRVQYI